MATTFSMFDCTPATAIAAIKAAILASSDWSNPAGDRVQATTTRGAAMVVDLADAAATSIKLQFGVYRTTGLADKIIRYLQWRTAVGTTSDPLHVTVSAGKDHLYITVEGPRVGEANPEDAGTYGSYRPIFGLCDVVPYFAADTIPAVVCLGTTSANAPIATNTYAVFVSRNAANTVSWVPGVLETLQSGRGIPGFTPVRYGGQSIIGGSSVIVRPYLVFEDAAGLRGRMSSVFNMGWNVVGTAGDFPAQVFARITIGAVTYIGLTVNKRVGSAYSGSPFAEFSGLDGNAASPVVAVPYS